MGTCRRTRPQAGGTRKGTAKYRQGGHGKTLQRCWKGAPSRPPPKHDPSNYDQKAQIRLLGCCWAGRACHRRFSRPGPVMPVDQVEGSLPANSSLEGEKGTGLTQLLCGVFAGPCCARGGGGARTAKAECFLRELPNSCLDGETMVIVKGQGDMMTPSDLEHQK